MATESRLRWAILGCARISRRGLIPGIRQSLSGTLHAIASRDRSTAEAWAAEFGIPRAYGSYEAAIADSDVDAVYIPLPNELHAPWVKAAAAAGKHVLCEKPLALDQAEARSMVDFCRECNVVLMEAFMWRHQPRTRDLCALVASGAIGTLRLIRSSFSFPIDSADWRLEPSRGGGALWDVGTYGVSTARLFAGEEPSSLRSRARFGTTGVDLSLTAELAFPSGLLATLDCSFEQPFRCEYELVGTLGTIRVPHAYLPPERPLARIEWHDGQVEDRTFANDNQYAVMVDAFSAGVRSGRLAHPAEDGLQQMIVLDAILGEARG